MRLGWQTGLSAAWRHMQRSIRGTSRVGGRLTRSAKSMAVSFGALPTRRRKFTTQPGPQAGYPSRVQMPRVMRRINRDLTNRLMTPIAAYAPRMAVVRHVGRKSGRAYRTPVLAFPLEHGILTPLPYGTDTDWVLNLLAAGGAELEVFGRRQPLDAEAAMELVPASLGPLLRLLDLPGFMLLDRVERARTRTRKRR